MSAVDVAPSQAVTIDPATFREADGIAYAEADATYSNGTSAPIFIRRPGSWQEI